MLKDTIKKLRTEQGLSQDELAERIHVVRQTRLEVGAWHLGSRRRFACGPGPRPRSERR